MNKLEILLNSDNVNVYQLFDGDFDKLERKNIVKKASSSDLKKLIAKYDDHERFAFMEDFIIDGNADNMSEAEYWEFIEEVGL